ncbi:hypothetical protein AB0L82_24940 [Nocardia sp. NPDC052001]|uniref:hypothetical protein n=1 Tax=Nocardia sp. NPDC052001 TaxID=3154853 RepID=UPI003432711C
MTEGYNEWAGDQGLGHNKSFKFSADLAQKNASLCAAMLWAVEQLKKEYISLLAVPSFSSEASGRLIADKFGLVSDRLRDEVLTDHATLLTNMAQAFINAASEVQMTESNSAAEFDKLKSSVTGAPGFADSRKFSPGKVDLTGWRSAKKPDVDGDGEGVNYTVDKTPRYDRDGNPYTEINRKVNFTKYYQDKLADLPEIKALASLVANGEHETMPVEPEAGAIMKWERYLAHYNLMSVNIDKIEDAARNWDGAANFLDGERGRFVNGIAAEFRSENWTGGSGPQARAAVERYDKSTVDLISSLRNVGKNLGTSASWLRKLQTELPTMSADDYRIAKGDPDAIKYVEPVYAAKWDEWYGVGLRATSNAIPFLKSPQTQKAPGPSLTDNGAGGNPSKGSPSGSPSGTPSGTPDLSTLKQELTDELKNNPVTTEQPKTQTPSTTTTTDQTSQLTSLLSTLAQQGSSLAQSLVSSGSSLIQSLQKSATTTDTTTTADQLKQQLAALTNLQTTPTEPGSPGGSPKTTTGGGGGGPVGTAPKENPQTKLFPRSTVSSTTKDESTVTSRAGLATGSASTTGTGTTGASGTPMGSGAQAGSQGAGKEHKRPEFLRSGENLAEGLGDLPVAVTPVAEK